MSNAVADLLAEWHPIEARIRALDTALWQRATDLPHGLGRYRNVWHNAMISLRAGEPWREVDYDALRRAIHIDEVLRKRVRDMRPRLWDRLYRRYFPSVA